MAHTGFVEINSAVLHYNLDALEEGHENLPTLVFIHAGIADMRMWQYQHPAFSEQYRVLRYDMRGYGYSDSPPGTFDHTADLLALLNRFDLDKVILCGTSMGGNVALKLALTHPERVSALITVGTIPQGWHYNNAAFEAKYAAFGQAVEALFQQGKLAEINDLELRWWIDGPREPSAVDPAMRALVAEMNLRSLNQYNPKSVPAPTESLVEQLSTLACPLLVLVGELDQPNEIAAAAVFAQAVPHATTGTIPNATHLPSLEQPEAFNRTVLDFLQTRR
jgi:pimeloyl-ACP methyl ester carboxylesterase